MNAVRCIGYLRVSTERQADEVRTSLADQEKAIRARAARLGLEVLAWYRDEGVSGATVHARPAFRALLAWCAEHPCPPRSPGFVLVLNDSRFGRFDDPEEAAYWRHHLLRVGWHVRFAEGDESDDLTARSVMRAIGSAQASEYRRTLQRNSRRGMRGAMQLGYWTREAPFGYRRCVVYPEGRARVLGRGVPKSGDEKVRLTPHEGEAALVRWAFSAYAAGEESLGSLALQLQQRAPGRRWSRTVLHHMLRNAAYVGDVEGGRRAEGEPIDVYVCRDAHPALVSRDVFAGVQARLSGNRRIGRGRRVAYVLSGLILCPHCGEPYVGGGHGGRKTARQPDPRIYRDRGGPRGLCPGRIGCVMRHILDGAVLGVLTETITSPAVLAGLERNVDDALGAGSDQIDEAVRSLQAERARIRSRIDRLVGAVADGTLQYTEARRQLARERQRVATIDAEIAATLEARPEDLAQARAHVLASARDADLISRMAPFKVQEFVRTWLAGATFDKRTRELEMAINPLPSLRVYGSPGPAEQEEGRLLVRRVSLARAVGA